jgi:hypothetical protein
MRKRRTKAEVEHDKAVLQSKKDAEKQNKDEGVSRVAQLEDKMAIDDANVGRSHPRSHKGIQVMLIPIQC